MYTKAAAIRLAVKNFDGVPKSIDSESSTNV